MEIMFNGWGCLALLLLVYCITEIVKYITAAISSTKSLKYIKDIPDDQREKIIEKIFGKDSEVKKNNESND